MAQTHSVVCVLGADSPTRSRLCTHFAKKSSSEALEMYHRRGVAQTLLNPASYPDKLNHMLAAVSLSDACIFLATQGFRWSEAECTIALSHAGVDNGVLVTPKGGGYKDKILRTVSGTCLERYMVFEVESDNYGRLDVDALGPGNRNCGANILSVDNVFNVKGVGTVALGFVVCGTVSVHDTFKTPEGKEVRVQSIQVMDEDVDEAGVGTRIGVALRGASEKELGDQLFLANNTEFTETLEAKVVVDKYYRQPLETQKTYHLAVAGQVEPTTIQNINGENLTLKLGRPIPAIPLRPLLANMNQQAGSLRVVGHIET
jgi:selenocysteine-specific translation elongation factor